MLNILNFKNHLSYSVNNNKKNQGNSLKIKCSVNNTKKYKIKKCNYLSTHSYIVKQITLLPVA